ncbi:MAG TPA: APC family permease [Vicinamibacterales bacterium]|nr:APC family permease [Vicinamibacterales bacterium]
MAQLRRELGRWDLTAIGINQVIGGAVFAMPAALAAIVGGWSPFLVVGVGIASMLIALTFAEVGSRFESTGGPYIYTRAAFGRFPAFEVGWMQWFTRVASWASVINVLIASLGFYWPAVTTGPARVAVLTAIIAALALINIFGIRQSAWVVNGLTIGKLVPLAIFIVVGLTAMDVSALHTGPVPALTDLSKSALLLIFAFGGYEVIPVPAGESKDPRRDVPFALIMTIVIVTVVFALAQIVSLGTLPDLASSKTPLADAAARFMGGTGAVLITVGAVISTLGNNMGQALSGPRNLFALAENGDIPRVFATISRRFGTPVVAILFTAAISLVLAATGTFVGMAAASAVSRLVVYVATCAAALRLRSPQFAGQVPEPTMRVPFGAVIPVLAILIALAILAGATPQQLRAGLYALTAGAVLFTVAMLSRSTRDPKGR